MGIKNILLKISCICTEKCFYRSINIVDFFGNQHIQAKLKTYINMVIEFGKIIIGCLLVFTVPQLCNGMDPIFETIFEDLNLNITNYNITLNNQILQQHPCTINEIFDDIFGYKIFVIMWNFLCLMLFFINFILELYREKYIINNFEYTISKPLKNIFHILKNNNDIENKYMKISRYLYYMNYVCSGFMFLNIIFSAILVYIYGYDGYRSITGLFSSVLLTLEKLYHNYSVLYLVINQYWVFSTKNVNPVCYNVLNPQTYYHSNYQHENADDLFDIEKVNPKKSYNYCSDLQYFPLTENTNKNKNKNKFRRIYRTEASIKLKERKNINRKNNVKIYTPYISIGRNVRKKNNMKQNMKQNMKNKLSIERTIENLIENVMENPIENPIENTISIELDISDDNIVNRNGNMNKRNKRNKKNKRNKRNKRNIKYENKLKEKIDFLDEQSIT